MIYRWKPDKHSAVPLYTQISDYLRSIINSAALLPGDKLPSQRLLVKHFDVSRTTILTVLEQLKNEGLIISKPQSCTKVAPAKCVSGSLPNWDIYTKRAKYKPGTKDFRMWSNRGGLSSFALSADFSYNKYLKSVISGVHQLYKPVKEHLFSKYGFLPLRQSIAKHIGLIGIQAAAENILICSSTFTAANLIYSGLTSFGSNFIHEKPSLINTVTNIHSIGVNMIGIPMDENGISCTELKRVIPKCRYPVIQLDTCDQVPTGIVMSKNRKRELLELARIHKIPVLEIEHMRDAWHSAPFPPPIKSMEGGDNVIYTGSFIRSHPVDFRICWIIADRCMIEHLSDILVQADDRPSMIMQAMANELFLTGIYYSMMENLRKFIRKRRDMALELCRKHLSHIAVWQERNCGFNFWLNFPDKNARSILARNYAGNYYPGYFFNRDDSSHILFCPSSLKEEEIEETILMLAQKLG